MEPSIFLSLSLSLALQTSYYATLLLISIKFAQLFRHHVAWLAAAEFCPWAGRWAAELQAERREIQY